MENNFEVTFDEILEQMRNKIGVDAQEITMKDAIIKKMVTEHTAVLREKDLEIGEREKEIDEMKDVIKELKEKLAELQNNK